MSAGAAQGRMAVAAVAAVLALAAVTTTMARADAVMVLAGTADEVTPVDAEVNAAVVRGAQKTSAEVTTGSVTLADTALMAGCDPEAPSCLDAVSDQLGVQRLVIVTTRRRGDRVVVEVAATRRGSRPVRRSFTIGDDPAPALSEIESTVPRLLDGSARRRARTRPVEGNGESSLRTPRPAIGLVIGGGALVAAGATLWLLADSTQREIDDAPVTTPGDLRHLADLESRANTYAGLGNGLVIGGAIAATAGVVWIVLDRRSQRRALRITPVAGRRSAGLSLEASW